MTPEDDALDQAIADWLLCKEADPDLLPGEFARRLPQEQASEFLSELEQLAQIDELTVQAEPRDLPRRFGEYRVLGELGRGAVGAVFDAEHIATGKRVALKMLHPHVAHDLRSTARFQREVHTASALVHPGIVPVLGFGETNGTTWLAMARVAGRSLDRLLTAAKDPRDVDHDRAAELLEDSVRLSRTFADAADALEFAHRNNVVHRDVKPANLMLREDHRLVLLDFGLASARDADTSALTRTGDFLGTPLYMAPEQAVGAENGVPASDIYGLGAVLYECLVGQPPVAPGPLAVVLDAVLRRDPLEPRRVRAGVPQDLARIAMQCLEKSVERRYATAAAFADDLRRYSDGKPVRARATGWPQRAMRFVRRRPLLLGLAGALLLLAPVTYLALDQGRTRDETIRSLERDRDLAAIPKLLAGAPERITVFGGASLRYYARFGFAEAIPAGTSGRSAQVVRALALVEELARRFPGDSAVLRVHVELLLDIGDRPERTRVVLQQLLRSPGATPGDRAMAAVFFRRMGAEAQAQTYREALPANDAMVAYWSGFWFQSAQQHHAAIRAFDQALGSHELSEEHRYFALLHRGWCLSCPDVCRLRAAQDDLLQAGALRPEYGTARLLWAALHCLDEEPDLERAVAEVTAVLASAEPWLHVLTARVLQALAEPGSWLSGPAKFGGEFSPIARMPIAPARAAALAGLSLTLLDPLVARVEDPFEVGFHRVAGMTLLGRFDDAVELLDALSTTKAVSDSASRQAALQLQRARLELASGHAQRAQTAVQSTLALAPNFVTAHRFAADLAAHLGDPVRELQSLNAVVQRMRQEKPDVAVYPDAIALLPELELRLASILRGLGRAEESTAALPNRTDALLHGASSDRSLTQLTHALGSGRNLAATSAPDSPLRWLHDPTLPVPRDASTASAALRGWLPKGVDVPEMPGVAELRQATGVLEPADVADIALVRLLPHAAKIASEDAARAAVMLERADRILADDPEHSEARLLRAVVLFSTGGAEQALQYLAQTQDRFADDLRGRFVAACAAALRGDRGSVAKALTHGPSQLTAGQLRACAARIRLPGAPKPEALLALIR